MLHVPCFLLPLPLPIFGLKLYPQLSFSSIVFLLRFLGLIIFIFVSFMHVLIIPIFFHLAVYALIIFHLLNEINLVPNHLSVHSWVIIPHIKDSYVIIPPLIAYANIAKLFSLINNFFQVINLPMLVMLLLLIILTNILF